MIEVKACYDVAGPLKEERWQSNAVHPDNARDIVAGTEVEDAIVIDREGVKGMDTETSPAKTSPGARYTE